MMHKSKALPITAARVIVTCPGRNFVTLKIETDDGVTASAMRRSTAASWRSPAISPSTSIPCLIGRDAHRIEDIWQYLYRGAYWRRGPVTMSAIAAVDTALWDIKAKVAGLPLYQLLGGRSRERGAGLWPRQRHTTSRRPSTEVARLIGHGLHGDPRCNAACPGLASTYGVVAGQDVLRAGRRRRADRERLVDTEKYLRHRARSCSSGCARASDRDVHLLHDVHHRLTPIEAARLGKDLEPYHLFWLEDPAPAENAGGFRLIRQHTTTPLAVGEVFNTIWDCKQLIEEQLIDYIRTTVVHAGGITHLRRIASLAELYQVRTGCHGATDLRRCAWRRRCTSTCRVPNFGIQEYMRHTRRDRRRVSAALHFTDGAMHPGECAGPRRGHRRGAGGAVSLPARLLAGESSAKTARCGTGRAKGNE